MSITYEAHFNGYPIQTNKEKNQGCYTDILQKLQNQMEYMTTAHNKTFPVRLDVRYPQDYAGIPQQKDFSRFCKNFKRNLENNCPIPKEGQVRGRRPKGADGQPVTPKHRVDPSILLVPEQHDQNRPPHGHVVIMVNGNSKRNPKDIFKRAEREWGTAIGVENPKGLVHLCEGNHFIDRNADFEASVQAAFFHNSYVAKVRGKEHRSKGAWKVIGTRTPKVEK